MPPLSSEQIKEYINSLIINPTNKDNENELQSKTLKLIDEEIELLSYFCNTPREVKLLINTAVGIYNIHTSSQKKNNFINYLFLSYLIKNEPEILSFIIRHPNSKQLYEHFNNMNINGDNIYRDYRTELNKYGNLASVVSNLNISIKQIYSSNTIIKLIEQIKSFNLNTKISFYSNILYTQKENLPADFFNKFVFNEWVLSCLKNSKINVFMLYFFGKRKIQYADLIEFFNDF